MKSTYILMLGILLIGVVGYVFLLNSKTERTHQSITGVTTIKNEDEWKKILTPEQYHILREGGTEQPFTGALLHTSQKGTYISAGCKTPVFRSEQKYDSGTGWPSFWAPINGHAIVLREDTSLGIVRTEVLDTCGGHLGHVFDDGPAPTGKRYCMNSLALEFIPDGQPK